MQASSNTNKWVINLSHTPLTTSQESLLSKGPNYAIALKNPSNLDYITGIETACQKLNNQNAEELRTNINGLPRKSYAPRPNLNKEENKALVELKKDKNRIILTADKGVALVVLDKKDYIGKAQNLLVQPAYRTLERDPTNKRKAKLITMLRRSKRESGLEENLYKSMYPTGCTSHKFYGLPKIHKTGTPSGLLY